jgi:hypothetical protein
MPRKGKDIEKIVEMLHKMMLGPEYEIKSPDYFIDQTSGQKREVDISIRFKVDYIPFVVIVECRDHKKKENVTWIEQLVTKRSSINVNRVIAVSTSGFTKPAKESAEKAGIVTQVLSKITPDDINSWLYGNSISTCRGFSRLLNIKFDVLGSVTPYKVHETDKVFLFENEKYSIIDIFRIEVLDKQPDLFNDVDIDGSKTIKTINLPIPYKYCIQSETLEIYNIVGFVFEVELWYEQQKIPFSKIFRFGDEDKPIIEWAETKPVNEGNRPVKFSLSKRKNNDVMNLGIEFLD